MNIPDLRQSLAEARSRLEALSRRKAASPEQLAAAADELEHCARRLRELAGGFAGRVPSDQYRAVVEDQTEVISRFRADGTLTFANEVFCRVFGGTAAELIGKKWQPSAVAEDVPMIEAQLRRLSPAHPVVVIENRVHVADGAVRWMQFVNRAFFDESGGLVGTQSVGRDITERKLAEEALRKSEEQFLTLFRASPNPAAITRVADGTLHDANDAFLVLLGMSRSEAMGRTPEELGLWPNPEQRGELRRRLQSEGRVIGFESQVEVRKGETRFFLLSAVTVELGGQKYTFTTGLDHTARKQMEDDLRQNRALLRSFYDSTSFMMGVVELEGDQIFGVEANSRVADFFSVSPEQLAEGSSVLRLQEKAITQLWVEKYRQCEREQQAVRFEYQHPTKTGPVWLSANVAPLPNPGARRSRFSFVVEDITDRKRAEEALHQLTATLEHKVAERTGELRESERSSRKKHAELEHLYRTAPVGLCQLDRNLRYVRINDRLAAINGRPAADHIGRTPAEMIPEIAAELLAVLQRVIATGQPVLNVEVHTVSPTRPGLEQDWVASYYPLKSEARETEGISVMVVEVTDLKRAAAALERTRDTLAEAQKIARLGSFEYVAATRQMVWSEEQYRIYGLDPAELPPTYDEVLARWMSPEDAALVNETFFKAVRNHSGYELEHRILRPDGTVRWIHDRAQPYFDPNGELIRCVGTTLDITGRRQAEEALRALAKQMEGIREQERQRLGRELHDGLSQQLTATKFKVGLLRRQVERRTPVDAAEVGVLEGEINRAIDQAREMARGLNPSNLVAHGLVAALKELAGNMTNTFQRKCTVESDAPVVIEDQEVALHLFRIAQEAVQNAFQHGKPRHVVIRLTEREEVGCLEVRDDGAGFVAGKFPVGQGLDNMRVRAGAIGGRLDVQPLPTTGTLIRCTWPARAADAPPFSPAPG